MSNTAKFINIWIYVFPEKENSTDWESSTEKPVQIALTFPLFSEELLTFFMIFFSSSIMRTKIQIVFTLVGA